MAFIKILLIALIGTSCSHVAKKEISTELLKGKTTFKNQESYIESLGLRDFDNSRDHSILAYPLTASYSHAFADFLEKNPKIAKFVEANSALEKCFSLKIEARDLGRDEIELENWKVFFTQNDGPRPLEFVRVPEVSPRKSVKHRITQRGRETWWISEVYACSQAKFDLAQDFSVEVERVGEDKGRYQMSWQLF